MRSDANFGHLDLRMRDFVTLMAGSAAAPLALMAQNNNMHEKGYKSFSDAL
jgi:hypothetical protein